MIWLKLNKIKASSLPPQFPSVTMGKYQSLSARNAPSSISYRHHPQLPSVAMGSTSVVLREEHSGLRKAL